MNQQQLKRIIQKKEQTIKQLKEDKKYWRKQYTNILNAYFELHHQLQKQLT